MGDRLKSDVGHKHSAADLVSGTVPAARLPGDLARTADITALDGRLDTLEADTGWIALTLNAGFETRSGTPRYRKRGGVVYLSGLVGPSGGGAFAASTSFTIANLPAGYRPAQTDWFTGGNTTGQTPATVVVTSTGDIQVRTPATAISYAGLGAVRFLTD